MLPTQNFVRSLKVKSSMPQSIMLKFCNHENLKSILSNSIDSKKESLEFFAGTGRDMRKQTVDPGRPVAKGFLVPPKAARLTAARASLSCAILVGPRTRCVISLVGLAVSSPVCFGVIP